MVNKGQTWVNEVQHGELRVDVGERGRTWSTQGRCGLTWYNMTKLGQMWVNVVQHGQLTVDVGERGTRW